MLRTIRNLALSAGLVALAAPALAVPVLYGGNDFPRLFTIDDLSDGLPNTSVATGGFVMNGLAYSAADATMYAGNDTRFFKVSSSGVFTDIDPTGTYDVNDLVFGPGGVLYGGNDTRFFSIDPTTGAMTNINASVTNPINALAYDPVSGLLYGANANGIINQSDFFTIDPTTGAQTMIDATLGERVYAMAVHPLTGVLYGGYTDSVTSTTRFFTIDKATGSTTLLGSGTSRYGIGALTFVPEPGTLVLLSAGLLGLAVGGRKRA